MSYTLMHVSDLHASWRFLPRVADQVARLAHNIQPDLTVISGDLVLRATLPWQWERIKLYLRALPQPQLIVPGNHDVPLFNGFYRLFAPLRYYRRHITSDINPVFTRPGLAVVGGCTAHGLTISGGKLSHRQIHALDDAFARFDDDTCKVLVLHHHVIEPPRPKPRQGITNVQATVRLMDRCGVDLFLCGHTHISFIGTTQGLLPNQRRHTIISQCGTTTSNRTREQDLGKNSFHIIVVDEDTIRITPHVYQEQVGYFMPLSEHVFERLPKGIDRLSRVGDTS